MSELKPCPFCGGEAKHFIGVYDNHPAFAIHCGNPTCWAGDPPEAALWTTTGKAIEAWNTRDESFKFNDSQKMTIDELEQHFVEQACAVVDECVDTQSDVFIERYLTSDMEDIKSILKQALRDKFKEGE